MRSFVFMTAKQRLRYGSELHAPLSYFPSAYSTALALIFFILCLYFHSCFPLYVSESINKYT
jgi:hypothetical protein